MFAVIKTGGKQYRVAANDEFTVERLAGEAGDRVTFAEVLMVGSAIGAPFVAGASVVAEIVEQTRGPKVVSFKKRRRQNSKRTRGHRQDLTLIRIGEILTDGKAPSEASAEKPKRASRSAKAEAASEPTLAENAEAPVAGATSEPSAANETADAPDKPKAARKPKADKAAKE